MIRTRDEGEVRILQLAHGRVSALDVELAEALAKSVDELVSSPARAAVLTGTGSVFSAGVDLFRVIDGGGEYVERFLPALGQAFRSVFCCPKPIVAALNGHAIAGGCVLAAACDYRVMARGDGTIGIPELVVGVPFPALAVEIMRAALPAPQLEEAVLTGAVHPPEEAWRRGFVHELVESDALPGRALEIAREMGSVPRAAFSISKHAVRAPFVRTAQQAGDTDRNVLAVWKQPGTIAAIRAYLERTLGRKRSS